LYFEAYQNSGTQGPFLAGIVDNCNLQQNDKTLVLIGEDCPGWIFGEEIVIPKRYRAEMTTLKSQAPTPLYAIQTVIDL
jgi:hypothetical protein